MEKSLKTLLKVLTVGIVAIFITFNFMVEISAFAVAICMAGLAVTIFWIVDTYAIPSMDTVEEIKKGNVAYSIFLLAIAIIIAAAFLAV